MKEKSGRKKYKREWNFKKKYNLTLKQHRQMYIGQNGCCAICEKAVSLDKIDVDHDHKTGKVRGLLCRGCNLSLGHFGDNPQILFNAIRHLQASS
ncbi:hypothetical protein LCGC14_0475610 [marine sediment metagenome]|uniref:Recombination endonuclease VII n=1 Tax=marine sediment metagenome TaxID=412755 RepID=A0A0F9VJQ8_9ZZZZ